MFPSSPPSETMPCESPTEPSGSDRRMPLRLIPKPGPPRQATPCPRPPIRASGAGEAQRGANAAVMAPVGPVEVETVREVNAAPIQCMSWSPGPTENKKPPRSRYGPALVTGFIPKTDGLKEGDQIIVGQNLPLGASAQ